MLQVRRTAVAVAAIGAVSIGAVTAAAAVTPRPGHTAVKSGSSKITLSKSALKLMKSNGLKLHAISPAKFNGKTLSSPIKSGTFSITSQSASVVVGGGFKMSKGAKSVSISKVHSQTTASGGSSTAVVSGHGRIAAITTGPGTITSVNPLESTNFTVTLAKPLVKVLDKEFGTKIFKRHSEIGTGSATLNY